MNLYLIWQDVNTDYDTYDSAVVAASDEEAARNTHPSQWNKPGEWDTDSWAPRSDVKVQFIGVAAEGIEAGPICTSYNAG